MFTRRRVIGTFIGVSFNPMLSALSIGETSLRQRVSDIIQEYSEQGIHRTGTETDGVSADWLKARISELGVEPAETAFPFKRVEVKSALVRIAGQDMQGVPLYDCGYTDEKGITGSIGMLGSDADIGVVMISPFGSDVLHAARVSGKHKAIVAVTDEKWPTDGVATVNAEDYSNPFGPPVIQIAYQHWGRVRQAVEKGDTGTVVAQCRYVDAIARNIGATIKGKIAGLDPLVIMTPRSGWWQCASERGGGIACWLEMMRAIKEVGPDRDVIFTANTGHELAHLGLDHYLSSHQDLIKGAFMWVHLGANFAAKYDSKVIVQYSDDQAEAVLKNRLKASNLTADIEVDGTRRPWGEARNIYDGKGHYISLLATNGLFHHPQDVWPDAVDLEKTVGWVSAFSHIGAELCRI
ncbi:hypothetical protein [Kordiimonas pumila]|uniref:Peptidase M28 domain-containing protein n=1 Tax=Kordiimonas pumila TaxID=2161677 RepID=A0ABV7D5R0_9PROT|nr:hypothetical protein [Kordiimonas pumila]